MYLLVLCNILNTFISQKVLLFICHTDLTEIWDTSKLKKHYTQVRRTDEEMWYERQIQYFKSRRELFSPICYTI